MMMSVQRYMALNVALAYLFALFVFSVPLSGFAGPGEDAPMGELKATCEAGDIEYCVALAEHYKNGIWLPKRPAEALGMFENYCEKNNMEACLRAGIAYFHGDITQQDRQKAVSFFTEACSGDDAAGCRNAGLVFANGWGAEVDSSKSTEFYNKACSLGDIKACDSVDIPSPYSADLMAIRLSCKTATSCLKAGHQSARQHKIKLALANFNKACEFESSEGCYELAKMFHSGESFELASQGYEKSCILENTDACVALAMYYIEGKVTKNEQRGLRILVSSCEKDEPNMRACNKASYRFSSKHDSAYKLINKFRDYSKAAKYSSIACYDEVDPLLGECAQLGYLYSTGGFGLDADPVKATKAYLRGCAPSNYGSLSSCAEAGRRLLRGEGAPQNTQQAISLFEDGCRAEDYDACYFLALEYDRGVMVPRDAKKAGGLYKYICEPTDNSNRTFRNCAAAVATYETENQFSKADKIINDVCEATPYFKAEDYNVPSNSCIAYVAATSVHECELAGRLDCLKQWSLVIKSRKKSNHSVAASPQTVVPLPEPKEVFTQTPRAKQTADSTSMSSRKTTSTEPNRTAIISPLLDGPTDPCAGLSDEKCFLLGINYNVGKNGVSRDLLKARGIFVKACNNGHAQACEFAADGYRSSDFVLKNDYNMSTARKYFVKACDLGRADGCFYAAGTYPNPEYDKTLYDADKLPLLERACKMGSRGGCNGVDQINNTGDYTPR